MVDTPSSRLPSRRAVITGGAGLLATFALATADPAQAEPLGAPAGAGSAKADLARYRPVAVSSTDYAATPAEFAVDGVDAVGVRGTGWRAEQGDVQWIAVDLQALCSVSSVVLTFEAVAGDPTFDGDYSQTSGSEVLSAAATAFVLEASSDGKRWTTIHQETGGTGGRTEIALPKAVRTRWVRMTSSARSNGNPVGVNGFEVWGTATGHRPPARGWTSWGGLPSHTPALAVAGDGTVPIESGWTVTMDDMAGSVDGAGISSRDPKVAAWVPAAVPGTVLTSLVAEGHLPDPVAGFNNLHVPEALSRHSWWYRRAFGLPRQLDTSAGRHIWLEFDGITHTSEVWVNGRKVGTTPNPFTRGVFDITGALLPRSPEQVVAVKATPMAHPGSPGDKSDNGSTFVQSARLYLDAPSYLAASGWDWMPAVRDRSTGLWNHVRLRSTGSIVIGDPRITTALPKLPATDTATVAITVPVRNVDAGSRRVTVRARFDRVDVSRTVTVAGGASVDVAFTPADFPALTLRRPALWWPNGYGDPTLHELTLTASADGRTSDQRTTSFGIREFGYASDQPIKVPPAASPDFVVAQGSDAPGQTIALGAQHARYVRLALGQRATQYGFSIWRFAVLNGSDTTDLALHHDATASSTGETWGTPDKAVDGDNTTRWTSTYADDQWLQVDLGSATDFDTVQIAWENAYALDVSVQTSDDGTAWTDVKKVDNAAALGNSFVQTETFAEHTGRYLRVQGGRRATGYGISMWRLSAYDSAAPTTDLALRRPATSSSDDGNPASNATDGQPRTRWSSGYQDDQWIQVDFGAPTAFDSIAIDWEAAFALDYVIQVSDDGVAWTDVKSVDNRAHQLTISVNGVKVFARGGNWGWDELLRRTDGRLETAVRMHREMNFTMIRNWLGSSDREELYALADRYGILIWNDFWEAGTFVDDVPGYLDAVRETIRRYRTHPSIVVWCGANEEEPPAHLGAGMEKIVADEHGEIVYIPNSAGGVVSGHGPYYWVDPAAYFDKNTYDTQSFGFHTELGMPVVSVAETMKNMAGDQPAWPISEVWNHHDWSDIANQRTSTYKDAIDARLGASTSIEDFARRAQFVNYENHRAMFEAWNAHLWSDASGLLLWMSHPAWYSTVWQTYDYDLDVNGAYFGSRKGAEPVHVQVSLPDWQVIAVNHTPNPLSKVTATATLYDLSGRRIGQAQSQRLSVAASDITTAFTIPAPSGVALHLVRLELRDGDRLLSQNTYWRYAEPAQMQALNTLGRTSLGLRLGRTGRSGDETTATVTVTNRGARVAPMVRLGVRDARGSRVLPAYADDNYLWLLPGESRDVRMSWPSDARGPRIEADAYNAPRVTAG